MPDYRELDQNRLDELQQAKWQAIDLLSDRRLDYLDEEDDSPIDLDYYLDQPSGGYE